VLEIRWHGRGGQGAVTAAKVLAKAIVKAGKYVQAFPEYGPERRGAPVKAFDRIDDKPIVIHSQVYEPDVVVVIDPTLVTAVNVTEGLKNGGVVIVNWQDDVDKLKKLLGRDDIQLWTVDASRIAMDELGREITNMPMLAAVVKALEVVELDVVKEAAREFGIPKIEANLKAMDRAYEEVSKR